MEKSEIIVMIVDDDPTLLSALSEAVKREGFKPLAFKGASEALNQYKIHGAQLLVIDCLLPKSNGVDLAVQLRQEGAKDTPLILTSGVFRDKAFSKDALKKTGALVFLQKPFHVQELVKLLHQYLDPLIDEALLPLETLLLSTPAPGEKVKVINQLEIIHGFDIPWICTSLMNTPISGVLKLASGNTPASISFHGGKITQVEMQSPESYFGNLLIEHGFLTIEQLDSALKVESKKRIGERLVDLNFLSPHAIDFISAEQMAIRLSKIIGDSSYSVTFEETETPLGQVLLDTETFAPFLIDWLRSKISLDWLKQRYMRWLDSQIIRGPSASNSWQRIWSFPFLKSNKDIVTELEKGTTMNQILTQSKLDEDEVYRLVHVLVCIDYIKFKAGAKKTGDSQSQLQRLKKVWENMRNQDYFSVLGLTRSFKVNEVKKSYHELAKIFHPDKLSDASPNELKDLAKQVFGRMTEAYNILSDEHRRTTYVKELEMGRAEKILQAEALFEAGKSLLTSGQSAKALEKFRAAEALKPPSSDLLIHLAWALLTGLEQDANSAVSVEAERILGRIPPEDRHNATYYFVKGYLQRIQGDLNSAKKNVAHALALKPKFIEAERLLRFLDLQQKGTKPDLLHGDLKNVVGALFKKS